AEYVDPNYRCNLSSERLHLRWGQIHDIWRRQVVSNGELVLRPARQRKQPANTKPCRVTKPAPAPRVTRRRGRDNAGPGETATRIRRQARLDACADHAVRDLGSTDNHISDDDPDNANGEG
ncbi:hypothetical protein DER44DRAFT_634396, partial [Fusarium oxysporum]